MFSMITAPPTRIGKEAEPHQEQGDHPAEHPEGFLLEQPDEEIRQPGPSLGLAFCGGFLLGVAHSLGI